MKRVSWFVPLIAGAVLGIGVIVACSDDSPGDADAAACNCPAAEPPLTGRVVRTRGTGPIDANGVGVAGAGCNGGGILLGGSCRLMSGNRSIYLTEAGADVGGAHLYYCKWSSASGVADTGIAEAVCLMPTP